MIYKYWFIEHYQMIDKQRLLNKPSCVDLSLPRRISRLTSKLAGTAQLDQKSICPKYLVTFSRSACTHRHTHMSAEISCRVRVQSPTTRNLFRARAAQFATNSLRRARPEIYPLSNRLR